MLDRSRTQFHDKNLQKSSATFTAQSQVFTIEKSVALMVRKYKKKTKDLKSYGSTAK